MKKNNSKFSSEKLLNTIMFASVLNILLSGYIFYDLAIPFFDKEVNVINHKETNSNAVSNNQNGKSNQNIPSTDNKDSDMSNVDDMNNEEIENQEVIVSKKEKETLTTEELNLLISSRDPFGIAPVVFKQYEEQEKVYNERIDALKSKIDQLLHEEENPNQNYNDSSDNGQTNSETSYDDNSSDSGTSSSTTDEDTTNQPTNGDWTKPMYSNNGKYIIPSTDDADNNGSDNSSEIQVKLTEEEVETIATEITTKDRRTVPKEWIIALAKLTSDFQPELSTTDNYDVTRKGLTQYRADKARFIQENLGGYYRPSQDFNATNNINLSAHYLYFLREINDDPHFIFTTYWFGETIANAIKDETGSYETDFSLDILQLISNH